MKNKKLFVINVIVLAILLIALFFNWKYWEEKKKGYENIPQVQSISDQNITMYYDETFGLAVKPEQILVKSYIPPCDENFDYCFYYNKDVYEGTNFESAGIRIKKRDDLDSSKCLSEPPLGFAESMQPDATRVNSAYSTSLFSDVGGAAAGHYSSGSLYRLYIKEGALCYEFETRIGESQFANYPEGSIKQFTDQDRDDVKRLLVNFLANISLGANQRFQLP